MLFKVFLQSLLLTTTVNFASCRTYYVSPGNSQLLDTTKSDYVRVRNRRSITFVDKDYQPLPKMSPARLQQYAIETLAQSATQPKASQFVLRPLPPLHPKWSVQANLAAISRGFLLTLLDNAELINQLRPWFHIALILLKYSPWIIVAKIILLPALALAAAMAVTTPPERKRRSLDQDLLTGLDALDFPFELEGKNWMEQLKQLVTDNQNQARSAVGGNIDGKPYPTRFNCCLHPDYRNLAKQTGAHGVVRCTPEGKKVACFNKLVYLIDVGGQVSKPVKLEQSYVWW